MTGPRRLYLYWDPAISGAFRRRLEGALGRLNVETADGDLVDVDPENPGVIAAIASAAGGWAAPAKSDIVIQAGPGEFPSASGALRLTAEDIDGDTQRWSRLVERLRDRLGLASLALPADQLEVALNKATQRADDSERAMATARLNEANAERQRKNLEIEVAEARTRIAGLEQENADLLKLHQSGRFALGLVPADLRAIVAQAREHAWRAQLVAARAAEAAATYPDVIAWGGTATYSGENRNTRPHQHGVLTFRRGSETVASYRGEFVDGKRAGLGIGASDDGLVWSGQWAADEACGFGILEAPDGRRFEGKVAPDSTGAPKPETGWTWPATDLPKRKPTHHAVTPSLPAPAATAD